MSGNRHWSIQAAILTVEPTTWYEPIVDYGTTTDNESLFALVRDASSYAFASSVYGTNFSSRISAGAPSSFEFNSNGTTLGGAANGVEWGQKLSDSAITGDAFNLGGSPAQSNIWLTAGLGEAILYPTALPAAKLKAREASELTYYGFSSPAAEAIEGHGVNFQPYGAGVALRRDPARIWKPGKEVRPSIGRRPHKTLRPYLGGRRIWVYRRAKMWSNTLPVTGTYRKAQKQGMVALFGITIEAWIWLALGTVLVRAASRSLRPIRVRPRRGGLGLKDALAWIAALETEAVAANETHATYRSFIMDLITQNGTLTRERDRWKLVAESQAVRAEAPPRMPQATSGADDKSKYRKLRAVVIKTLHPDHAGGGAMERAAKGELFKVVWPEIERIDRG